MNMQLYMNFMPQKAVIHYIYRGYDSHFLEISNRICSLYISTDFKQMFFETKLLNVRNKCWSISILEIIVPLRSPFVQGSKNTRSSVYTYRQAGFDTIENVSCIMHAKCSLYTSGIAIVLNMSLARERKRYIWKALFLRLRPCRGDYYLLANCQNFIYTVFTRSVHVSWFI